MLCLCLWEALDPTCPSLGGLGMDAAASEARISTYTDPHSIIYRTKTRKGNQSHPRNTEFCALFSFAFTASHSTAAARA